MRYTTRGFSMIELLIAMVIVAMIAAFAVPQYSKYVVKSELVEAVTLTEAANIALVETHINEGYFVDTVSGDKDVRNASAGLEPSDDYESDVIHSMWVEPIGGSAHEAQIVVQLQPSMVDKAGLGADPLYLSSIVEFDIGTQSYSFTCNQLVANHINPDILDEGC